MAAVWHQQTNSPILALVHHAKNELEKQVEGVPVIEDLAENLHVSVSYLNKIFKAHMRLSPYEDHLQVKIQRSKEMLHNVDLSIKQIARLLGFQNPYHFSKLFKKKTGLSPPQWRVAKQMPGNGLPPKAPDGE